MTEAERRARLEAELLSDRGYAEGRRRFPRTLTSEDAERMTGELHARIDDGCAERAELARVRKRVIACTTGCNHCCEQPVTVYLPEALRIAGWLRRDENAAARAAFLAAYPAWRERAGDGIDAVAAAIAAGDVAAEERAHIAEWQRRAMCAFNDAAGLCVIYPVRPAVCRHCHALETADRCRADRYTGKREDLPSAMSFVPLDQVLARGKLLARAMHHALGGARGRPAALCRAVHELLSSAPAA